MQARHFCFTLFHFEQHLERLRILIQEPEISYLLWEREICPSTGTPHLQGYVQVTSRMRLDTLKRLIGIDIISLRSCNGSDQDNYEYCTKDGTDIEEYGERCTIRARKRVKGKEQFAELVETIKDGASINDIIELYPELYVKHHAGIEKIIQRFNEKTPRIFYGPFMWNISPDWTKSIVVVGPTGIGKTQYTKTLIPNPYMLRHIDKLKKFNSLFHGALLFDDMEFTHWPVSSQIHLVDTMDDADINVKHAFVTIPAGTKRIFTCNNERFPFSSDPAVLRRLQVWVYRPNLKDFFIRL